MTLGENIYTFKLMNLFFLKKNFCDGWDSAFWLMFSNILAILVGVACFFGASGILKVTFIPEWLTIVLSLCFLIFGGFAIVILMMSVNEACARIADFKSVTVKEIFTKLKDGVKDSILFTLLLTALVLLAVIGIPFYLRMGNMFGILFAALVFWALLVCVLALQWFFPLRSQMHGDFKKTLKKCFIILFDNTGFSIFIFVYNLILTVLSCVVFVLPGLSGICLSLNNALRLRLYKYDWLEEHPDIPLKEARKQIPWGELIAEDYETLGPRSFKSFIFPWK